MKTSISGETAINILNNAGEGIITIDTEGKHTFVNKMASKLLCYSPDELIGKKSHPIWHSQREDKTPFPKEECPIYFTLKDGKPYHGESWFWRKDGTGFPAEYLSTPITENGIITGAVISFIDYTQRRKQDEKIEEERNLLRTLINNMPDRIYFKDRESRFVTCNEALIKRMRRQNESDIKGKSDFDLLPPEMAQEYYDDEQNIIKTGIPVINKEEIRGDLEEAKWSLTTKVPIRNKNGEIIGIVGIGKDITERKRNEIEKDVLLEILTEIYFTESLDDMLKMINSALNKVVYAENIFIALHNPVTGLFSFPYFVDKFDSPPPPTSMSKSCTAYVFRTGKPLLLTNDIFNLLVENGDVELVGSPSPSWIGIPLIINRNPIGVMVMQHYEKENAYSDRNIRFLLSVSGQIALAVDRKRSEEEIKLKNELLQAINAEKDKFFSIIAHDLRGPLSSFVMATQILIDEIQSMSLEDIKDLTLTMKNDASNVYKLLENLLEWSRLKRGVIEFTPQKISLIEVINESLAVVSEMALKKGITISTNVADETMVFADRHMLETIIRNLISNSIKFSFTDSKIEINSHIGNDNSVKIFVTDNGIGMPEGIKNKLFMLNEKTNRKGTQGEASSGLGLILIKEFVEKHNGTISVESEEGKGSTFTFTLKLDWQIITENL